MAWGLVGVDEGAIWFFAKNQNSICLIKFLLKQHHVLENFGALAVDRFNLKIPPNVPAIFFDPNPVVTR